MNFVVLRLKPNDSMKRYLYTNVFLKWVLPLGFAVTAPIVTFGQIYTNAFTGTGTCPTQGNTPVTSTNATGTPLTRSTVTCTTAGNVFNSTTLNNTASINNASYIEFSVTPDAGAVLKVTSLSFFRQASNTAPNQLEVRYSTDGFANSTTWGAAPNSPTAGTTITWDFADFSVLPGTTLTFRFYPYGTQRADLTAPAAAANGTFRLDDVTVNGTSPLPVNLVSFTGKSANNAVKLNWVTAWEKSNQGFEVQKGTNAERFEAVGFVGGNSTTESQSVYAFTDTDVLTEAVYYYRLKQKDFDGQVEFSKIIAVRVSAGEQKAELAVFPNPNNGSFNLSATDSKAINVRLFTVSGTEVPITTNQADSAGSLGISAKNTLPTGLYFLNVKAADSAKPTLLRVLVN